jgi:hypothetical protein
MPCGSVPLIAALTRLGARKASEIVMFTLRAVDTYLAQRDPVGERASNRAYRADHGC